MSVDEAKKALKFEAKPAIIIGLLPNLSEKEPRIGVNKN